MKEREMPTEQNAQDERDPDKHDTLRPAAGGDVYSDSTKVTEVDGALLAQLRQLRAEKGLSNGGTGDEPTRVSNGPLVTSNEIKTVPPPALNRGGSVADLNATLPLAASHLAHNVATPRAQFTPPGHGQSPPGSGRATQPLAAPRVPSDFYGMPMPFQEMPPRPPAGSVASVVTPGAILAPSPPAPAPPPADDRSPVAVALWAFGITAFVLVLGVAGWMAMHNGWLVSHH
jgi:hypothetical protein